MDACKRIPVTEETWKKLGEMKKAGQTYDALIRELVIDSNKIKLAKKLKEAKEGKLERIALDDL